MLILSFIVNIQIKFFFHFGYDIKLIFLKDLDFITFKRDFFRTMKWIPSQGSRFLPSNKKVVFCGSVDHFWICLSI